MKVKILSGLLILIVAIGIALGVGYYSYEAGEHETAEDLLNAFYTFELETINENDQKIKDLTTPEIYERFTIASSNRQLRVYLKFAGEPTKAKIISHRDGIIYYYIDSQGFDSERTFALRYDYKWGKITNVAEYELTPLPQTMREDL